MKRSPLASHCRLLVAVVAGLALLLPRAARAQAERPALALSWTAPQECPQQARARQLVADDLGEASLPEPAPEQRVLSARASLQRRGKRWELHLQTELDGQPGERTLAASTCADVAGAAALVLAFAIDPGAALRHSTPAAATPPPKPVPAPAAPSTPPPTRTRLGVGASVRGDIGALPRPSVGVSLAVSLEQGAWSGQLGFSAFAPRVQAAPERPSAGGKFSLWAIAAAPCLTPDHRRLLHLRVCLPFEWQRLHASGYGVDVPGEASRSELLLGAELTPALHLTPHLELMLPLGAAFALRRPEFYLERIGSVFRASAVQGRAGLGLLARF